MEIEKIIEMSTVDKKAAKVELKMKAKGEGIHLDARPPLDEMIEKYHKEKKKLERKNSTQSYIGGDTVTPMVDSANVTPMVDEPLPCGGDDGCSIELLVDTPQLNIATDSVNVTSQMTTYEISEKNSQGVSSFPISSCADIVFPTNYRPMFDLPFKAPNDEPCTTIGYWVIDEIIRLGQFWPILAKQSKYRNELETLSYYIQKYGSVTVRETRNSEFIRLR